MPCVLVLCPRFFALFSVVTMHQQAQISTVLNFISRTTGPSLCSSSNPCATVAYIALASCQARSLAFCIRHSILPQEVKRLFGNVAPSGGHGLRVCKILKAEWYRQARLHKQYLSALLFDRLEDTVAMQQLRHFQRLADQSTEFLWARRLPGLRTGVAKKLTDQKPTDRKSVV